MQGVLQTMNKEPIKENYQAEIKCSGEQMCLLQPRLTHGQFVEARTCPASLRTLLTMPRLTSMACCKEDCNFEKKTYCIRRAAWIVAMRAGKPLKTSTNTLHPIQPTTLIHNNAGKRMSRMLPTLDIGVGTSSSL